MLNKLDYDHEAICELYYVRLPPGATRCVVDTIWGSPTKWFVNNPFVIKLLANLWCDDTKHTKLVARFCYSLLTQEQKAELDDCPRVFSQLGEMGLVDADYDGSSEGYTECSSWSAMGHLIKEIHDAKCEQECSSRVPEEGTKQE